MRLQPKTARVVKDEGEKEIFIDEVMVGDMVVIRPGERIPLTERLRTDIQQWMNPCLPVKASLWRRESGTWSLEAP